MSNPSTQFKPGQSGNPAGRPKEAWTMRGLIQEAMETAQDNSTRKKLVAEKLVELAISGEIVAIKEINQRIDGMPQQDIDLTSGGDKINPLVIIDTHEASSLPNKTE